MLYASRLSFLTKLEFNCTPYLLVSPRCPERQKVPLQAAFLPAASRRGDGLGEQAALSTVATCTRDLRIWPSIRRLSRSWPGSGPAVPEPKGDA